jgi:hypothetical protein
MISMASIQDVPGNDLLTIAEIRAVDERDEGLVEVEVVVSFNPASSWRGRPDQDSWLLKFHVRIVGIGGQGIARSFTFGPDGRLRMAVPRGEIERFVRAIRQAARDISAAYQVFLAEQREQARRDALAEPAKRARLAQDQARIEAVLAETGET